MAEKQNSSSMNMIGLLNDDLLQIILSRLPAVSFAAAACVNKSWNRVCTRILNRPKIASAFSLNPSLQFAVHEVVQKVLSEPIRPHFAIVNAGRGFPLKKLLPLLVNYLGSRTPIVITTVSGLLGRNAITDEFREVKFMMFSEVHVHDDTELNFGVLLTVGFLPGLKVDAIPLLQVPKVPQVSAVDQFVMDIRNYTFSVSGGTSPVGIIMFGDAEVEQKCITEKLDYAMSGETVIVGDAGCTYLYRSNNDGRNINEILRQRTYAVALVFASDKDKPQDVGEVLFKIGLSKGISPVGPRHKAVSVKTTDSNYVTWLTAKREGETQVLDGQQMLDYVYDQLVNNVSTADLYIGVSKNRKCSIGSEKKGRMKSLAYHNIEGGDEEYLYVAGHGIKNGDYFQFYFPDPKAGKVECQKLSTQFRNWKLNSTCGESSSTSGGADRVDKRELIGCFMFACCGRGESFFGCGNIDSSPFLDNFPEVPFGGICCSGEIGRGPSIFTGQGSQEESSSGRCCLHFYSTVYLLITYKPADITPAF